MTLKELITQVSFDNLLPYLKTLIVENESSLYAFREAYDRLRLMEPAPNFVGEIHVEWHQGILEEDDKWIGVSPMHDTSWEEDLAKEIVVEKDIQLSTEELAAHCLWEITFYGFSPKEIETHFDRMFNRIKPQNKYDIALEKLEESIWKHEIPRKYRSCDQGLRLINGEYFTKHRFHFKSIKSHLTYNDIRFGTITTDSDRPEVKVRVLLNKLTE